MFKTIPPVTTTTTRTATQRLNLCFTVPRANTSAERCRARGICRQTGAVTRHPLRCDGQVLLSCGEWHCVQKFPETKLRLSQGNLDHPDIERETESFACIESRRKM